MIADPDEAPIAIYAEKGGILEWISDSPQYPYFDIEFIGESPARKTDKLSGTNDDPVIVHITKSGKYEFKIRHKGRDGCEKYTGPFRVRSCKLCPP
jgi:hypothetical protein